MENVSLDDAWDQVIAQLGQESVGPAQLAFLRMAKPMANIGGSVVVAVPSEFTQNYIETRLSTQLSAALSEVLETPSRLLLTVDPALQESAEAEAVAVLEAQRPAPPADPAPENSQLATAPAADQAPEPAGRAGLYPFVMSGNTSTLNPKYTFDSFVVGASNRFPHASSIAVAEGPGRSYNPLFIYGSSGLGKTHLLHAIGHYASQLYPKISVRYVSSEEFTNDVVNAIQNNRQEAMKRRYREVDILLIDDIQFLKDKERTVQEFFHTFNTLHTANKQIVITSDLPPKQLDGFEERLRSRFEMGLTADIQPPDLETRIAILRMKAAAEGISVDPKVLEYVADRISANIRELEGALLRVTAFANLTQQQVDRPLAERVLKDIVSDPNDTEITTILIIGQTAAYFDITIEEICSSGRARNITRARQIAMYLCRELTNLSLPKIGEAFNRDHTTVMYATRKISEEMVQRPEVYNHVNELTSRIKSKAREH